MNVCPVGAEMFHEDGRTDGRTDRQTDKYDDSPKTYKAL
jgi:hypothetical protein